MLMACHGGKRASVTFARFTAAADHPLPISVAADYSISTSRSDLLTEKYSVVRAVERAPLDGGVRHVSAELRECSEPRQRRPAGCYESRRSNEPREAVAT